MTAEQEQLQLLREGFDAFYLARSQTRLVSRLQAQALGDAYPAGLTTHSSCDRALLTTLAKRLDLRRGQLLLDAGCGTGGIGLWLARTLQTRLLGIDISPVATHLAARRARLLLAPGHAAFYTAPMSRLPFPDQHVHGIVCVDALSFAPDSTAALRELHRVLRPAGRAVITRAVRHDTPPQAIEQPVRDAGFALEHLDERPGEPAAWGRLYRLWISHETALRRVLGDQQAGRMLAEAHRMLPRLSHRRALVLTLCRRGHGGR
ncbi:methyltransferase domain-containing protein [Streptomyces sp. NPDC020719]|uniref:class I SAM-dependent methyltransferase n=1 Tax=Streptomyces sp. NPDC020719 TaxID=3154896 RepID=UPI00340325C5